MKQLSINNKLERWPLKPRTDYLHASAARSRLNGSRFGAANLPEPVDVAIVVDTYHHIDNRTQYFGKLKSSLRPTGRLVIVDFKADSPNGPPVRHRISPERVTQELKAAGYALVETLQFLPRQYCLVFDKGNS